MSPELALSLFALLVALIALAVWPRHGMVARLGRLRLAGERISREDALKHLFKCEYRGREATLESVAGSLEAGRAQAAATLADLRDAGLVRADRPTRLTDEGRTYALRIIRTHRLWERYLADRTGVEPGEWHERAEAQEHFLDADEVDRLSARLGHPRYDPHGDPIPTSSGEIAAPLGTPLSELPPGTEGMVTHLEDEPRELYDRLLKSGLSLRMRIRVLEPNGSRMRIRADGREIDVDPMAAGNVTVDVRRLPESHDASRRTLSDLAPGASARVAGISAACPGVQRRRLLDLGIVPGTPVTSELSATAGDPVAYRIRGALVALRREQQDWIRIEATDVADGEAA